MSLENIFRKAEASYRAGKYLDALKHLKKLEREAPGHPEVAHLKGVCLFEMKRYAEAEKALSEAYRAKPNDGALVNALATACRYAGDTARAEDLFRRAIALRPDWSAYNNFANFLKAGGRHAEAIEAYRRAIDLHPRAADPWSGMAGALRAIGQRKLAIEARQQAAALVPGDAGTWAMLGHEAFVGGERDVARTALAKALDLQPDNPAALLSAGMLDIHSGDAASGTPKIRKAAAGPLTPDELGSAVLALNYDEGSTSAEIRRLAGSWDKRFGTAKPLVARRRVSAPDAPVRVGIVASYFGQHPVSAFVTSWLPWAAEAGLEIVVFHSAPVTEADRANWAGVADWIDIRMNDTAAAERIAAAGVDVLVCVAGHGDNSRAEVFAHRAAPLQVLAFAYFCTTGIAAMDAVLADPLQIPPGGEDGFSERVVRLPNDYVCFRPPAYLPDIAAPDPAAGPVLGSFNNPSKYGPKTARLWADVLAALPAARLLLKAPQLGDAVAAANVRKLFGAAGIDPDRLIIEGMSPHADLLATYNRVTLALDPVAYSGGITTLESLWMGVPVVTLPGEKFCARHSLTHLRNAGLGRFVARDGAHYVELAREWLNDPADMLDRRRAVRAAIEGSPVSDGAGYARDLAATLRDLLSRL